MNSLFEKQQKLSKTLPVSDTKAVSLFQKMRQAGQGMTEYILILALIALVAFGIITTFGGTIKNMFQTASSDANAASEAANNGANQ